MTCGAVNISSLIQSCSATLSFQHIMTARYICIQLTASLMNIFEQNSRDPVIYTALSLCNFKVGAELLSIA